MYIISAITCTENNQRLTNSQNQGIAVKTVLNTYDKLKRAFACLQMTSLRFYVNYAHVDACYDVKSVYEQIILLQ